MTTKKKIFIITAACFSVLFIAGAAFLFSGSKEEEPAQKQDVSLVIYDRNGVEMRSFLSERETYFKHIGLEDVSPWLILAAVAVEDKRFFTHGGVDFRSVLRALWQNAREGEVVSGASTITQQLARNITPKSRTFAGKIKEALAAFKIENKHTKQEILQEYFNRIEFYNRVQGAEAAALFYFDTPAKNLSLAQSAFLAAMIQSPAKYNPLKNMPAALERQKNVLDKMLSAGFITAGLHKTAAAEPVEITARARPFAAPHLAQRLSAAAPGTAEIHSTIDAQLQNFISALTSEYLKKIADKNVTNAAVIAVDNRSGEVLAYIGSADYFNEQNSGMVDGTRALRQPGSALKPFIYALALENGFSAASVLKDEDTFFRGGFRPRNYSSSFHGPVRMRRALGNSYNVPVIQTAEVMGTSAILPMLHKAGFGSLEKDPEVYGLGIALGNGEVTLEELAAAYSMLARGGVLKPLVYTLGGAQGKTERVFKEETAYIITDILSDNTAREAAFGLNSPLRQDFPFAAKTGTSKDYKDNWAAGYTPRWTIAVWTGNFNGEPMRQSSGITGAAPLLKDVAAEIYRRYPSGAFKEPPGIERRAICANPLEKEAACSARYYEVFDPNAKETYVFETEEERLISNPQDGDIFKIDPAAPRRAQKMKFKAREKCAWVLNGKSLERNEEMWWDLEEGRFALECKTKNKEDFLTFTVLK